MLISVNAGYRLHPLAKIWRYLFVHRTASVVKWRFSVSNYGLEKCCLSVVSRVCNFKVHPDESRMLLRHETASIWISARERLAFALIYISSKCEACEETEGILGTWGTLKGM